MQPSVYDIGQEIKKMETLVYEDNIEKDYQTVVAIDWKNLDKKVKERPEDYIFILSSSEMKKFMELNKQIYAGLKGKGMAINEAEYIILNKKKPFLGKLQAHSWKRQLKTKRN